MGVRDSLGSRLRSARLEAGMSQAQLSERTGLPKPTLSRYENDHVSPSIATLRKLCDALGVAEGLLLHEERSPDEAFIDRLHELGVTFESADEARNAAEAYVDSLDEQQNVSSR